MKKFDTRWFTVPVLSVLALIIGDVNPWLVSLIVVSVFKVTINY